MDADERDQWRRKRMRLAKAKAGSAVALGKLLGYKNGAHVGQMISGHRPITEKTIEAIHALEGYAGWFVEPAEQGWPFKSIDPMRWVDLDQKQRERIESNVTDLIEGFEAINKAKPSGKLSGSSHEDQRENAA
jgi:hypothetical protein